LSVENDVEWGLNLPLGCLWVLGTKTTKFLIFYIFLPPPLSMEMNKNASPRPSYIIKGMAKLDHLQQDLEAETKAVDHLAKLSKW